MFFIPWVGSKRRLLDELFKRMPSKIDRYCEPFVGGGSVLFEVLKQKRPKEVLCNDFNPRLINLYSWLKNDCESLIKETNSVCESYCKLEGVEKRQDFYYNIRDEYNSLPDDVCKKAADFLLLIKIAANGLYRENSVGKMNVSFNRDIKRNPKYEYDVFKKCSDMLSGVDIRCGEYLDCLDFCTQETFVYLDPPYRKTESGYTTSKWNDDKQLELASFVHELNSRGCEFMLSNSDSGDGFFDRVYGDFEIERVSIQRLISRKIEDRKTINEILVCNYRIENRENPLSRFLN